jgi:hypothetical protein
LRITAAYAFASLVIFFGLSELVARMAQPALVKTIPAYYYRQYFRAFLQQDPVLLWAGKPGSQAEIANSREEKVSYRLNSLGWRGREFAPLTKGANALVLGDSFSFGIGVPEEKAYPRLMEKIFPGVNVWAFAHMSYAPDQHLLVAQRWLTAFPWAFLVVQLSNNDLLEVTEHRWERINSSSGIPAAIAPPAYYHWFSEFSEAWDALAYWRSFRQQTAMGEPELRTGLGRLLFSLEKILALAQERKVPALLVQATDWGQTIYGEKIAADYQDGVLALAKKFGAPVVQMQGTEVLPAPDAHWTENGHSKAAESLALAVRSLDAFSPGRKKPSR